MSERVCAQPPQPELLFGRLKGMLHTRLSFRSVLPGLFLALFILQLPARAQSDLPELPLPQESIASEQPAPSAHLFLRELAKRQREWRDSKGRFTMLANLFPAVLEQEGVVYNMEANGEWLLQNGLLVFQVLDDYRRDYDVLAWEQDRVWSVNSSEEIGSRGRLEMDEIAREILGMVSTSEDNAYGQARTYLSLAELTRYNALPAEEFRPLYTSLGYQVARPAQGVLLLHRAGSESSAQRNTWYGAVAFGGSCAWVQQSGGRMRIMPYMNSGAEGVDGILRSTLKSFVASQNRYKGAYQHFAELKDLSGLYFERLDLEARQPRTASGVILDFRLAEDKQSYTLLAELSGLRLMTDHYGEITTYTPFEGGENFLPLPGGQLAETGFMPDEDEAAAPAEGLDSALTKARLELLSTVLKHAHSAEEAYLIRHGSYGNLRQLHDDGLLVLDEVESDRRGSKDSVHLRMELADDAESYELSGQAGDVLRVMDHSGVIRDPAAEPATEPES